METITKVNIAKFKNDIKVLSKGQKELRNQRNVNNSLILDNGRLKNKINLLTKQIEDLKTELKQEF